MDGQDALANIVASTVDEHDGPVKPGHGRLPSRMAITCALMCLFSIGELEPRVYDALRAQPRIVPALLRLSHASHPCARVRRQADRLLQRVSPGQYADPSRYLHTCRALVKALAPVPATAAGSTSTVLSCPVCMGEPSTSRGAGAGDHQVDEAVFLPCFHYFHTHCIINWLQRGTDACPICKRPVLAEIQASLESPV